MGSLPQSTEAWPHKEEEDTNSSHWWFGVITDSQFKQFKDAGTGVKTRGAGEGMTFKQAGEGAGEFIINAFNYSVFLRDTFTLQHTSTADFT